MLLEAWCLFYSLTLIFHMCLFQVTPEPWPVEKGISDEDQVNQLPRSKLEKGTCPLRLRNHFLHGHLNPGIKVGGTISIGFHRNELNLRIQV